MPDWNNDGNYDWQDSAMDYMVYKSVTGGGGGSGSGGGCLSFIGTGFIILLVLYLLGSCSI